MEKNKIQKEIKRIERKQKIACKSIGAFIGGGIVLTIAFWLLFFIIGSIFYFTDNYFYLTVDRFSENAISYIIKGTSIACAFCTLKLYGYYKAKKSLKRILSKKRKVRKVVR